MKENGISILGLGYVGLPLAMTLASGPYVVLGFDVDEEKVSKINRGENFILDVDSELLSQYVKEGKISATSDFSRISEMKNVIICVPTPLDRMREPDMSLVEEAAELVAKNLQKGQLVVLESTTYPGTTREVLEPILAKSGLKAGKDYFLAFSPERVDPGNDKWKTDNTPKIVGGYSEECTLKASELYGKVLDRVHEVSSPEIAEMAKLLENIFRCVNIALVNELALLCDRMGINIWEVIEAAATKPFGFMAFYPGPGLGGHCIPIDPFYLSWKAKQYDFYTEFIELSGKINENMPYKVVEKIALALNSNCKSLKNSNVLVVGVSYKKDVPDVRESPALKIIELLREKGTEVSFYDPFIASVKGMESQELTGEMLRKIDCAVIATDHSAVDYEKLLEGASLIVDTRNVYKNHNSEKIVRL